MSWKKKFVRNWGRLGMKYSKFLMEDCLETIIDYRGKTPHKSENGILTLSAKSVKNNNIDYSQCYYISDDEYKKFMVRGFPQKGDILLTTEAPLGMVAKLDRDDIAIAQRLLTLRGKKGVLDNDYLMYYLQSPMGQSLLKSRETGTTVTGIKQSEFRKIEISIPDLEMQKKVSNVLNVINDKIKLNNNINNNLEQQAQAIFANEFLSLDMLPEGWKQASLIDIADYLNGLAMQKYRPTADESGIPVLKIKELRQGFCDDNSELCSPSIKSDYIIHDGDVIFSWSGSLLVDLWCGGICGLNQHLFKVTSNKYDKWFYYAWTKHHLDRFVAVAADKATTMGHIKRDELAKAEVLIPNEADYNRIGALLQPIYEMIISNRIENKKLAATRDILLPKLMNGEIDMSEVDYE